MLLGTCFFLTDETLMTSFVLARIYHIYCVSVYPFRRQVRDSKVAPTEVLIRNVSCIHSGGVTEDSYFARQHLTNQKLRNTQCGRCDVNEAFLIDEA
jgi:hypothetical protein